jgi:hypothetical protein
MRLTLQILASGALVAVVLWFMWKLPRKGEALFSWGPPLALLSAWGGLLSLLTTVLLWLLPFPDVWIVVTFLGLYPASIASGTLVLWIYRGLADTQGTIASQLTQAKVGITLGLLAVVLGYVYVLTHKTPFTPVG